MAVRTQSHNTVRRGNPPRPTVPLSHDPGASVPDAGQRFRVNYRIQHNMELSQPPGPNPAQYALHTSTTPEDFSLTGLRPLVFASRRLRSEASTDGHEKRLWSESNEALLNLLATKEAQQDDGS